MVETHPAVSRWRGRGHGRRGYEHRLGRLPDFVPERRLTRRNRVFSHCSRHTEEAHTTRRLERSILCLFSASLKGRGDGTWSLQLVGVRCARGAGPAFAVSEATQESGGCQDSCPPTCSACGSTLRRRQEPKRRRRRGSEPKAHGVFLERKTPPKPALHPILLLTNARGNFPVPSWCAHCPEVLHQEHRLDPSKACPLFWNPEACSSSSS